MNGPKGDDEVFVFFFQLKGIFVEGFGHAGLVGIVQ
jgi:hypothetical protein